MTIPEIVINQPDWLTGFVDWDRPYATDEEKMGLAIDLARANQGRQTGHPFGAAVFDQEIGLPVGVGVNLVGRCNNSILHAETMAIMSAQARLEVCPLTGDAGPRYELIASSEPCAMCLGAAWYAGVKRIVFGTLDHEILPFGFGLGPGLNELRPFYEQNGVELKPGVRSKEVLELFERM